MSQPAHSAGLNPIELEWDELDRKVKAEQAPSAVKLQLLLKKVRENDVPSP